jgi:hypothetical protein
MLYFHPDGKNKVPPKRRRLFTKLHGVTFHNTENLICNAMRNSTLISLYIKLLCNKDKQSTDSLLPDVDEIWYTRSEHLWEWPHICYDSQWNHNTCATYTTYSIFRCNTKLRKAIINLVMSVRPHGTARLLLDGFSWNLIFEHFSIICPENSSFIKIWQQ